MSEREDLARTLDLGREPFPGGITSEDQAVAESLIDRAFAGPVPDRATLLMRLNVALKALERIDPDRLAAATARDGALDVRLAAAPLIERRDEPRPSAVPPPMDVLYHEGPIARAYLSALAARGSRPRRIVNLVAAADVATGAPVARWLPAGMRRRYAGWVQRQRIHHWPRRIAAAHPDFHRAVIQAVSATTGFGADVIADATALRPLEDYADQVHHVLVHGLRDPALRDLLADTAPNRWLFTGGGIVPRTLLEVPEVELIHVHPGWLPDIRGADGVLWSVLLAGAPSASAFVMAPGIDTGDLIARRWLTLPVLPRGDGSLPLATRYRALFGFIDPWLRAQLLADGGLDPTTARPQDLSAGTTFRFMHPALRERALERIFPGWGAA